ncbi:methylmalonyl-CoA mutase subunit beta [Eudoraea sp.]|uniref:methylmalonyl-CoA mutase subunit beta n=1 Tax=Eudoraea sp. TaxID=1979955 RepID=UPI003C77BC92
MKNKSKLFTEFETVSKQAWKQKIQVDLKGADYNEALLWESPEGIMVKPFYNREDLLNVPLNSYNRKKNWQVGELIVTETIEEAYSRSLEAVKGGTETLIFSINNGDINMPLLLKKIEPLKVSAHFVLQKNPNEILNKTPELLEKTDKNFIFHLDVIGNFASTGNWFISQQDDLVAIADLQKKSNLNFPITINSALYQNAGANMVQQLAYSMAHANEYLHYLDQQNVLNSDSQITFMVAQGGNYFFEIAKIRALRILWRTLSKVYNIEENCQIIAHPSKRNKTLYDYNVNLLRTTTECMSAILGGADIIYNQPYDALYHKSNDFAERIGRNQLLILKEESYFDLVNNPADGAYYIESLTVQLAEKALQLFKQLEKGGGFLKNLKAHSIQKKIKESDAKEKELFTVAKEVLVGSNKYPNASDKMKTNLELNPFSKKKVRQTKIEPIIPSRLAATLEQNRLNHE